mmetsp:Transcript_101093/g.290976  ORF Transcript_101093/g.290976 Transcript_101093/m.290976 type:complete len:98 (+) Transcript_101093:141-434(+)
MHVESALSGVPMNMRCPHYELGRHPVEEEEKPAEAPAEAPAEPPAKGLHAWVDDGAVLCEGQGLAWSKAALYALALAVPAVAVAAGAFATARRRRGV